MKNIEQNISVALKNDPELVFSTSDDELFKRATIAANNQQGTKDLLALGMASLWVVFISLFMNILKPVVKKMAVKPQPVSANTNTTDNRKK